MRNYRRFASVPMSSSTASLVDRMTRMLKTAVVCGLVLSAPAWPQQRVDEIGQAFDRLYNFDFPGAQAALSKQIASNPDDPLPYAVRSSAYLFAELNRLQILESDFFADDSRIIDKKKLKPDPAVKIELYRAVEESQSRAQTALAKDLNDQEALFAMCITSGVLTDYTALVEKKQLSSLSMVKKGTAYAQR